MNNNLDKAVAGVEKADSIMYAIENTYLESMVETGTVEKTNRAINMFYVLWDAINSIKESLEKLEGDERVIDVVRCIENHRSKTE